MNKRKLYHWHKKLRIVSPWYFLIAAAIFLAIGIYGLRQNYRTMDRLRQAVIKSDQQNGDTEKALNDLRTFVFAHMNTNLTSGPTPIKPPIQLKVRYEQLLAIEKEHVKQTNAVVADQAEAVCQRQFPSGGPNVPRLTCIQNYIAAHAASPERTIPSDLYKFDFQSPVWSPDLAGISLVLSGLFFALFALRFATEWWLVSRIT